MARLEMLQDFVTKNPTDPFARYGLAMEYKNLGQLEEAAAAFAHLMKNHPDYVASYLHAGNTLVSLGRRDEARRVYEAGIAACARKGDAHSQSEIEGALLAL